MFRTAECTLKTIRWNFKRVFRLPLLNGALRPMARSEVAMGDITEPRPVNVSFSFFYINSLPISNWNTAPLPPLFIQTHRAACSYVRMHWPGDAHVHIQGGNGNIWRSSSNAQTNVSWRAPKKPSERLQTARHC